MPHSLIVSNLVKRFGDGDQAFTAVRGISFNVGAGTTCALLGGNGAGKTTTISMLLGLLDLTSGSITALGHAIPRERHAVLGRMNLTSPYVDLPKRLTTHENLTVFGKLYGVKNLRQRIAQLVEELSLAPLLHKHYGTLSAGQRTRVSLAKALINEPALLFLDEPTASLDPDVADTVRAHLLAYQARTGATFVLASHHMGEVERMAHQVLMLRAGEIVDRGTPDELVARHGRANMEEVFLKVAREHSEAVAA